MHSPEFGRDPLGDDPEDSVLGSTVLRETDGTTLDVPVIYCLTTNFAVRARSAMEVEQSMIRSSPRVMGRMEAKEHVVFLSGTVDAYDQ